MDTIWFGTDSGVGKLYDGETWDSLDTADGLISDTVLSIAIRNDTIWLGTDSCVNIFDGAIWDTLNVDSGLVSNRINSILAYSDTIWFGTDSGVSIYDGTVWDTLDTSNGLAYLKVNAIAVDSNENKWFVTDSGAYKYNTGVWDTLTIEDDLVNNLVNAVAVDTAGNVWFGTSGGVSKYSGANFTNYTTSDGLANNNVKAIAIDSSGNIWFGTDGGVSKLGTRLYGDVNISGDVETADASEILKYRVGKTSFSSNQTIKDNQIARADVSGRGGVTSYDASLILQKIVALITQFPVEMSKTSAIGDNNDAEIVVSKKSSKGTNFIVYQINADKINEVLSADLEISYDNNNLKYAGYELTENTESYLVETFESGEGLLSIAMAGGKKLNGKAGLLSLKFESGGSTQDDIQLVSALLNESVIEKINGSIPFKFELRQNFPNPFNPETEIRYQIAENTRVLLKIYNILGQEVRTLVDDMKSAGSYTVKWNGKNNLGVKVSSGVYIYRIQAGDFISTKKMVFLK